MHMRNLKYNIIFYILCGIIIKRQKERLREREINVKKRIVILLLGKVAYISSEISIPMCRTCRTQKPGAVHFPTAHSEHAVLCSLQKGEWSEACCAVQCRQRDLDEMALCCSALLHFWHFAGNKSRKRRNLPRHFGPCSTKRPQQRQRERGVAERAVPGRGKRKVEGGREEVPASARCLLSLFIFWLSEFTAETEARNEAAACTARAAWARKTFAQRVEKIKKYGKAENAWRKTRAELHAWKMIFGN